ncbi:TetR/AcrR family transcriptional regulator [Pseudonocardia nigra]|uniref:TetR/AcrR family transcriptional regulator n=1 Tax=Pseudonocardia nigra TaxID=1921578 RepID=UPI001C5F201C|nr:TetR/AcrR family transcriptional regulator [Pseudonocardia nigra]
MPDRRTEILDGALHVLAEHGMRGLTHRAVDAAAGIPPGSTSYYFRSRAALVAGCCDRLLEIDLAVEVPAVRAAADPGALAEVLAAVGVAMATAQRHRTLARYELSLAAVRDAALRERLVEGGSTIRALGAAALRALGATDPDVAADELAATLDGLVLTALVRGPRDPSALAARLRPPLERMLRAQPGVG